ncbi:MAG: hypothetical protein ACI8R4_001624 [Paracoccaceae bacterium]|jgi:uncharacterized protein YjiS (DUF1127 family)
MAQTTTNLPVGHGLLGVITRLPAAFGAAFIRMAESSSKMRQVAALQALSDAELEVYGIKREDIAQHVFSSSYWI